MTSEHNTHEALWARLLAQGAVREFKKKPLRVSVVFAADAGTTATLEGMVRHVRGDAIVQGLRGECWPVSREDFEKKYQPATEEVVMGEDGLYQARPARVQAARLPADQTVQLAGGKGLLQGRAGDWLVKGPMGDCWVVADGIFQATYAHTPTDTRTEDPEGSEQ